MALFSKSSLKDIVNGVDMTPFRRLYPFTPNFMDRKGLKYHYLDEGQGEPVVMLHGNPTWSFYYRNLVKRLRKDFRVIVPDHIGCGLSDKPPETRYDYRLKSRVDDVGALADQLNLTSINLVVHDWGGMIGMAYAVRHPERIKRLIVLNTAGFLLPKGKRLPLRLRISRNFEPFSTVAIRGLNLFAVAALYMAVKKKLPDAVKKGLIAPYNSWENRIATLKFVKDIPLTKKDPGYRLVEYVDNNLNVLADKPMLICWGEHDFVFDMDYLDQWRRRFPHAQVHTFSDAGHYLLEDCPNSIGRIVEAFVKKGKET